MTKAMKLHSVKLLIAAAILIAVGAGAGYHLGILSKGQTPIACTQEAKLCPDGSYVGRTEPNCEFAACPTPQNKSECTSDADCPSVDYTCEATQGVGTVFPGNNGGSTFQITNGVCKKKEGKECAVDNDCVAGLLCHQNKCINPIGEKCSGPSDVSCAEGYTCIQSCGPPLVRENESPPPYYCELNEYAKKPRACPICLASNTSIATPSGEINVRNIKEGMRVWSLNKQGQKIASFVLSVSKTPVPTEHKVVHLVLSDKREVWVSAGHPGIDGRLIGELKTGDTYDGARIESAASVLYWDTATYDVLPDSDTGYYWANGILLGSTLKK